MQRILVVLPLKVDRSEAETFDKKEYEIHLLHPSEHEKADSTLDYGTYLARPGFLTSYVDRAVDYVKTNGITAIMFSHDMASVVASAICQRTGLKGPSLESTFCSLHKYYSRKTENSPLWFDYIGIDDPKEEWKKKVRYPCILKAPFLMACWGMSRIDNESEMEKALAELGTLVAPFLTGYQEFFSKYLDLTKYPLAVENIAVVEEVVERCDQYCIEAWVDDSGTFTVYNTCEEIAGSKQLLCYAYPQFSLDKNALDKLIQFAKEMKQRFGLRNTFYDIEAWKRDNDFILVEVNCRIMYADTYIYNKMWGVSEYKAAAYLACGQMDKVKMETPPNFTYHEGDPIGGVFPIHTVGEGIGRDFIDCNYAKYGCNADNVFTSTGPGIELFVSEESQIKQASTSGVLIGRFWIMDRNVKDFFQRARKVIRKFHLRPQDSFVEEYP
jgi:hypothetical protein